MEAFLILITTILSSGSEPEPVLEHKKILLSNQKELLHLGYESHIHYDK